MDAVRVMQLLGRGELLDDIREAISTVGAAVVETQRPGTVTIKLKIEPAKGDDHMLAITDSIELRPPAATGKDRTQWFFMWDGELLREDPRQVQMELRTVERQQELRDPPPPGQTVREVSS